MTLLSAHAGTPLTALYEHMAPVNGHGFRVVALILSVSARILEFGSNSELERGTHPKGLAPSAARLASRSLAGPFRSLPH